MNTNSNFDREDDEIIFKEKEHFSVMPFFQDAFPYFLYSEKWYKKTLWKPRKATSDEICYVFFCIEFITQETFVGHLYKF